MQKKLKTICLATIFGAFISVPTQGATILQLNFDGNIRDQSANQLETIMEGQASFAPDNNDGQALATSSAENNHVVVEHEDILAGMEKLNISVWAKKDEATSKGQLLKKHSHYDLLLGSSRSVVSRLKNEDGQSISLRKFHYQPIDDTAWHHYEVIYDGQTAKLLVDKVVVDEQPFSGRINNDASRDLYIAKSPWDDSFDGLLNDLLISDGSPDDSEPPLEIGNMKLMIDDFSTPSGKEVIGRSSELKEYVKIFENLDKNHVLAGNREVRLNKTKGSYNPYIAFLFDAEVKAQKPMQSGDNERTGLFTYNSSFYNESEVKFLYDYSNGNNEKVDFSSQGTSDSIFIELWSGDLYQPTYERPVEVTITLIDIAQNSYSEKIYILKGIKKYGKEGIYRVSLCKYEDYIDITKVSQMEVSFKHDKNNEAVDYGLTGIYLGSDKEAGCNSDQKMGMINPFASASIIANP